MKSCAPDIQTSTDGTIANNQTHIGPHLRFTRNRWSKWILVLLAIKAVLLLVGIIVIKTLNLHFIPDKLRWLDVWYRWDVKEYLTVTINGYEPGTPNAYLAVRPPIVPLMIRGIAFLGVQNLLVAGFIMATVASFPVPVLMEKLASLDYQPREAERATWFLLIFPMSFCLHLPLSEGVFMLLVLDAFLAARNDDWLQAGLAACIAGATRVNGILLFPALLAEVAHQYYLHRKVRFQWAWVGLAPLGTLAYLTINRFVFGGALAFMKSTSGLDWPWISVAKLFHSIITMSPINKILWIYPQCVTVIFLMVICIWTCFKSRPSYSVWTLLNVALITSQRSILSLPRYAIVVFPMYFFLAEASKSRSIKLLITGLFIFLFLYFSALFAAGLWAF